MLLKADTRPEIHMRFLRYPGGKGRQLSFLTKFLPKKEGITGRYLEPFVGGGSVFLYLQPRTALISDLNKDLVELYKGIRNYPHKVWEAFWSFPPGKEAYYTIRDSEFTSRPLHFRAARTLYLNRTCFKGMWRHNQNQDFNVGYGGESRRWVVTHQNIIDLSRIFRRASIECSDFEDTLLRAQNGDFIFLDPPYKPGKKEMGTAHYINGRFGFDEQIRLATKIRETSSRAEVRWLMTNSSHPDICDLYSGFNFRTIPQGKSNRPGILTRNNNEVLISNY